MFVFVFVFGILGSVLGQIGVQLGGFLRTTRLKESGDTTKSGDGDSWDTSHGSGHSPSDGGRGGGGTSRSAEIISSGRYKAAIAQAKNLPARCCTSADAAT